MTTIDGRENITSQLCVYCGVTHCDMTHGDMTHGDMTPGAMTRACDIMA